MYSRQNLIFGPEYRVVLCKFVSPLFSYIQVRIVSQQSETCEYFYGCYVFDIYLLQLLLEQGMN